MSDPHCPDERAVEWAHQQRRRVADKLAAHPNCADPAHPGCSQCRDDDSECDDPWLSGRHDGVIGMSGARPTSKLRKRATNATLAAMSCGHELQQLERQFRNLLTANQEAAIATALRQYREIRRAVAQSTTKDQA